MQPHSPWYSRHWLFMVVLACVPHLCGAQQTLEDTRSTYPFSGNTLPTPPQQNASWTPDTTAIPAKFLSATRTLFAQGLADPRGGEYCNIDVQVGSVWGGTQVMQAHGWLLPTSEQQPDTGRFAVCWNGLVYPVIKIGEPADVVSDIKTLVHTDDEMRAKENAAHPNFTFYRFGNSSAGAAISESVVTPLKACLLLRLGKSELARRVWASYWGTSASKTQSNPQQLADPYLMLASDWTWALFDRAVCAHMRGDDNLALIDARLLTTVAPLIEAEAKRRGFPQPVDESNWPQKGTPRPYLDFLKPLPLLLLDEERRVAQTKEPAPVPASDKTKAQRIAELIKDLDQVDARQMGQPGGVSLGSDPRVRALIAEGEDAVEPLLDTLEHDNRLTHSVHFWRDFARSRSLIGVPEAAYVALSGILKTSFFSAASTGDDLSSRDSETRHAVAEQIRAYWNRFKGVSLEERWYLTLKDDQASPEDWLQAAANIVRPQAITVVPGSMVFSETTRRALQPGEKPSMAGEVLRTKSAPSVSGLLALRADNLGQGRTKDNAFPLHNAADMAFCLLRWDATAALPALQKVVARSVDQQGYLGGDDAQRYMLRLLLARASYGDSKALKEYATWIKHASPDSYQIVELDDFAPLWNEPHNPQMATVSNWLFNNPASPWLRVLLYEGGVYGLFESPLIHLPAFKPALLRKLNDSTVMGTVQVRLPQPGQKGVWIEGHTSRSNFGNSSPPDPTNPKVGTSNEFRICDYYAWGLWSHIGKNPGAPRCELYWSLAKRNAAVRESIEYVRHS